MMLTAAALLAIGPAPGVAQEPLLTGITITANGVRSDHVTGEESAADCARFNVDATRVAAFFAGARVVTTRDFYHDLDMSRCHASGTATLPSATGGPGNARWFIDAAGRGSITLADGSVTYFAGSGTSIDHDGE